jgi:hypothetical protein
MIDSELGKAYYRDNLLLKRVGVQYQFEKWQIDEYIKCSTDPKYFIKTYVKIISLDRGLILFDMHDYQEEMVDAFHNNRFSIVRIGRQSGKTTTSVGYLLWLSLFTENYSIAITANKKALAVDILSRYQLAYENLPMWLQQGIVVWNKGSVELENGSKLLAASTAASSIRGGSFNLVFMDEFAHVHNNLAEEFFTSTYPVISSGTSTKIIIVSTPRGMNLYYKMWIDALNKKSDYFPVDIHWSRVPGRDEAWKEKTIRNTSLRQFNQEFGCDFLGSTNTLIDGAKLQIMFAKDPLEEEIHGMEIFIPPIKESYDEETRKQIDKDHVYAMCCDVSEGKNLDYSTISVFDCSTIPYKQVAIYRNNQISPMLLPDVIKLCAEYYNNAHVLIEINNNPTVADTLYQDLEYENVFKIYAGNKKAQTLSESGKATQNGINMSPLVKRTGCSALKTIIETNKLEINSSESIYELTRFVATNNSFAAEEGANDDLAMTLVMFAWLTTQKLFIELSSTDIRKRLQIENNYAREEEYDAPPMPQFENPLMEKYSLEDGDLWEVVTPATYYY